MPGKPADFIVQLAEDLSPEDVVHVLSLLKGDITRLSAAMRAATASGDAKAFKAAAHGLAGAAGSVGAEALERVSRRAMTADVSGTAIAPLADEVLGLAEAMLTDIAAAVPE